jgi:hypothetical protein
MISLRSGTFSAQIDPEELLDHSVQKTRRLLHLMCNPEDYTNAEINLPQLKLLKEKLQHINDDRTCIWRAYKNNERDLQITVPADKIRSRKPEWVEARAHNRFLRDTVKTAAMEIERIKKLRQLLFEACTKSYFEEIRRIGNEHIDGRYDK